MQCYAAAARLRPDLAVTHGNLASALIGLRRPVEALPPLAEAVRVEPGNAGIANSMGGALLALDRAAEAVPWFRRALALDPELTQAALGLAMALLSLGDYAEGWAAYEARWRDPEFAADARPRDTPVWDGSDPVGRTILLHAEQGFGDTIQFVRYATLLHGRGAKVILEVQAPLVGLLTGLADQVVAAGAELPPHDAHCALMSLPHRFATTLQTIPSAPYLHATAAEVRGPGRNVGLVLHGAPTHPEDDLRSIAAELWAPVLAIPATVHLLQPHGPELPGVRRHELPDFAATAEIVAAMDLVIAVDTAVAHLAGAMGVPVWILLQESADFRWLRGREDSPWYPSARLFRQTSDWAEVMARVAAALVRSSPRPP